MKRAIRGFPITLGIAGAFVLMFITVPVLRVASMLRGRKDEHVACITEADDYERLTSDIERILRSHHFDVTRSEPSWWLSAPYKLLQKLGGKALQAYIPDRLSYWTGPELEVAFYPSDVLIRGKNKQTAWTHGILAEALARGPGLQTFALESQDLERQLRRIWSVYEENPRAHTGSMPLLSRVREVSFELARMKIDYDDWQVLYRQTLQLDRALRGERQLLESLTSSTEAVVEREPIEPVSAAPTSELVGELMRKSSELVKSEIALARSELHEDMTREIKMAKGLGVAGVCAITALNLILVAIVLALAGLMPGWASALVVSLVVLSIGAAAAGIGWSKRVKKPLDKTQKTLKEDMQWAKERTA
jgi:hypothetical protein